MTACMIKTLWNLNVLFIQISLANITFGDSTVHSLSFPFIIFQTSLNWFLWFNCVISLLYNFSAIRIHNRLQAVDLCILCFWQSIFNHYIGHLPELWFLLTILLAKIKEWHFLQCSISTEHFLSDSIFTIFSRITLIIYIDKPIVRGINKEVSIHYYCLHSWHKKIYH